MKTNDDYSSVICETCNNELRSFSNFRKDLIFKQTNLYGLVEGFIDQSKELEQEELFEILSPSIKREDIEIKIEPGQENDEDYNSMLSMEYLETVPEDEVNTDEEEQNEVEFSFTRVKPSINLRDKPKGLKKQYKRFAQQNLRYVLIFQYDLHRALCTHCGNSYYKDQLQRHIDVSSYINKILAFAFETFLVFSESSLQSKTL